MARTGSAARKSLGTDQNLVDGENHESLAAIVWTAQVRTTPSSPAQRNTIPAQPPVEAKGLERSVVMVGGFLVK
jgi:hypothetical protein